MITLRFVTGNDFVSNAIRLDEYGFWATHVEALMPDGKLLGAHLNGGVIERDLGYDSATMVREMMVTLPADPDQLTSFYIFLRGQVGKPYDLTAIAALVAERDWSEPDSWFCSELIAAALRASGWFSFDLATGFAKITPRDLLLILSSRVAITP